MTLENWDFTVGAKGLLNPLDKTANIFRVFKTTLKLE